VRPSTAPVGIATAIDVTPLAGAPTGIAASVAELLAQLAVLDDPPRMLPYAISARALRDRSQLPEGTRVIPGASMLISRWARHDSPSLDRWLRGAEVIHATNYLAPPSARPTLVTINDCSFVRHKHLCPPAIQGFEPVVRRSIERGVHVHVPSQFVAAEITEIFGRSVADEGSLHVVPWGVPTLPVPSALPAELARFGAIAAGSPFVLAIGSIEPRKNLAHLVAAFAAIAPQRPGLLLVLAGPDGSARPEIDQTVARLAAGVAERVVFTGTISDPARAWLLQNAALLAYPSIYEGFGFPILEAMTLGTPVLAARAGSIPEVADDAAILVEPTDEPAMSAGIETLLEDAARRDELVNRGRANASRYRFADTARAIDSLYHRLAG
jgi:glycosyltransferase involved in cell wall biosynthesis